MPTQQTMERFVALVEANEHIEALKQFYTDTSSMQENQLPPRVGLHKHIGNEDRVMARVRNLKSECVRPWMTSGDHVAIRWIFTFEWQDGSVTRMEEVAWQRWEGERVAEETFFYDPAQRTPRPASGTASGAAA